jgi:hypothetical protein
MLIRCTLIPYQNLTTILMSLSESSKPMYDSFKMKFSKIQNYSDKEQIIGYRGLEVRKRYN